MQIERKKKELEELKEKKLNLEQKNQANEDRANLIDAGIAKIKGGGTRSSMPAVDTNGKYEEDELRAWYDKDDSSASEDETHP